MEKRFLWIFFVVAIFLGFIIGIVYANPSITGFVTQEQDTSLAEPTTTESESMEPHTPEATSSVTITDVQPTFWERLFGITKEIICTDSDGGWSIYVKGTCSGNNGQYTDFCVDATTLREFACDNNNCLSMNYLCTESCYNGACIEQSQQNMTPLQAQQMTPLQVAQKTCSDSDGGLNFYSVGTCTDSEGGHLDSCSGSYVKEYYCAVDGNCHTIYQKCGALFGSISCSTGACDKGAWLKTMPLQGWSQSSVNGGGGGGGGGCPSGYYRCGMHCCQNGDSCCHFPGGCICGQGSTCDELGAPPC